MASQQSTVDFIVEQMSSTGIVSAKKMFGEYGIYCPEKAPLAVWLLGPTTAVVWQSTADCGREATAVFILGGGPQGRGYCGEKMVALVCDDQLFVKSTPGGKDFLGECSEGPPYPGAKPCFIISGEKWDDHEWLSHLMHITAAQLPIPKKKAPKKFV